MLVLIVRVTVKGNPQKTMCSDHERKHYLLNTSDLLGSVPPFLHLLPWLLHFRCQPILWAAHTNYIKTGVYKEYNKGDYAVRVTMSTWILVAGADRKNKWQPETLAFTWWGLEEWLKLPPPSQYLTSSKMWRKMYPDEAIFGLKFLGSINTVINEAKSCGLATSKLSAESKDENRLRVTHIINLCKFLL